jgi:hypothetical protein
VGPEALDVALDSLFHHIDSLFDGIAVGDATLEGGDNSGESPFRFFPQENTVTDLVHKDHPDRSVYMNQCSLEVIIDMATWVGEQLNKNEEGS